MLKHTTDDTHDRALADAAQARAAIEDYLDRVCLPLIDTVAYAERQELRREIAQHIRSLADAYIELGDEPLVGTRKALEKFGDPAAVAKLFRPATARRPASRGTQRWLRRRLPGIGAAVSACSVLAVLAVLASTVVRPVAVPTRPDPPKQTTVLTLNGFHHTSAVFDKHTDCRTCHATVVSMNAPQERRRLLIERTQRWMREDAARP